jgi:hypothetical protein
MNQKIIGTILLMVGIIITLFVFMVKDREDEYIANYVAVEGTCYLKEDTCLHEDRDYMLYIVGWVISTSLFILGMYILLFDHTAKVIMQNQERITSQLREVKHRDEFKAFLSGFSADEQVVLKVIHEQEGIKQSTLRFKTGFSKTTLSLLLKDLESREIITKKETGKTNEVYLRKKF